VPIVGMLNMLPECPPRPPWRKSRVPTAAPLEKSRVPTQDARVPIAWALNR
jgi:hypothetical protein